MRARPSWPGCRACGPWVPRAPRTRRWARERSRRPPRCRSPQPARRPSSRAPCGCASWPAEASRRRSAGSAEGAGAVASAVSVGSAAAAFLAGALRVRFLAGAGVSPAGDSARTAEAASGAFSWDVEPVARSSSSMCAPLPGAGATGVSAPAARLRRADDTKLRLAATLSACASTRTVRRTYRGRRAGPQESLSPIPVGPRRGLVTNRTHCACPRRAGENVVGSGPRASVPSYVDRGRVSHTRRQSPMRTTRAGRPPSPSSRPADPAPSGSSGPTRRPPGRPSRPALRRSGPAR